ncbi:MAG: twin-arginine translocase TatA/TatE family subunit [Anaerolineales bacterium]|jgi:sec-independent protein translocase protein TatB
MDILGIGPLELLFIMLIALIVVGPKDLARVGRTLGRTLNRIYRSDSWRVLNEASKTIRTLPNRLAREAALEELDAVKDDVNKTREELESESRKFDQSLKAWTQPPTKNEPPPESDEQEPEASTPAREHGEDDDEEGGEG